MRRNRIVTKPFKKSMLLLSLLYIVLGLILVIWPVGSRLALCYLVGIAAIIFGIVEVTRFFTKKELTDIFDFSLIIGVISILFGIVLMVKANTVIAVFGVAFGIAIVFDSVVRIQLSLNLLKIGDRTGIWLVSLAVLMLIYGIVLMFDPFAGLAAATVWYGIGLLADGAINLASFLILNRNA